eukprot:gene20460-26548_t
MEKAIFESRDDYVQINKADSNSVHEVIFAIKQNNLDVLDKFLMDVSTPKSPKYGKYLTRKEVASITANPEANEAVVKYCQSNGLEIVKSTPYGEYITAKATIDVWEKLFGTTFYEFKHVESKRPNVFRAYHYSIDSELSNHLSAVFNTVQLPSRLNPKLPVMKFEDLPQLAPQAVTGVITPAVLNSYYNITSNTGSELASQAVFESLGQYYSPSDLTQFQETYDIPVQAISEDIGGYSSDSECTADANNCAEANLDVQYLIAVSQGTPTIYWYEDATDSFLAWIQAVAASDNPPLVNSISYGSVETSLPSAIANAFNTEALKLGTLGVSILVSSGDDGVANFQARTNPTKCGYNPSFPATSQYVTAIGATQGAESDTTEIACSSRTGGVITTGGGFSTIFSQPSWQASAVANYFAIATTPVSGYTSGRGYPDLSLAGTNYEVVIGGAIYAVSGTSASSPSVAGLVSLVNAARLEAGFYAAAGWDPLTGFGSVDYAKFYDIFYNL